MSWDREEDSLTLLQEFSVGDPVKVGVRHLGKGSSVAGAGISEGVPG